MIESKSTKCNESEKSPTQRESQLLDSWHPNHFNFIDYYNESRTPISFFSYFQ